MSSSENAKEKQLLKKPSYRKFILEKARGIINATPRKRGKTALKDVEGALGIDETKDLQSRDYKYSIRIKRKKNSKKGKALEERMGLRDVIKDNLKKNPAQNKRHLETILPIWPKNSTKIIAMK